VRREQPGARRRGRSWWSLRSSLSLLLPPLTLACAVPTSLGQLEREAGSSDGAEPSAESSSTSTTFPPPTITTTSSSSSGIPPGTGDTDTAEPELHAWVMRYDVYLEMQPDGPDTDTGVGSSAGETGGGFDPDALVVQLSTGPDDCEDPWASLQCGGQWSIWMLIPSDLQVPGTYQLFDELNAIQEVTEMAGSNCGGGGGSLGGVAELAVVSEQEVSGQLSMTETFGFDGDVAFTALGCG